MFAQTVPIDQGGRITLPQQILEALGVQPEAEVVIALTETGVVLKPKYAVTPITDRLAAMNPPVSDWEQMEQEMEVGRYESC